MFDVRTVIALTIFYSFIIGGSIILFGHNRKRVQGLRLMGSGVITYGFGFLILAYRGTFPDFFTIIIANVFIAAGVALIVHSLCSFLRKKPRKIIFDGIILAIFFLLYCLFTYVIPSVNARIIVSSVIQAIYFGEIIYILLSEKGEAHYAQCKVISYFFIGVVVLNIIRMGVTIVQGPISSFMQASTIHALGITVYQIMPFVLAIGCFWIANTRIEKELQVQALTDPLTKLFNRMAFRDIAKKEMSRGRRNKESIALIMCDIDFFKNINDSYGHQVGDEVLQQMARELERSIRLEDIVARYGGEEFVFLIPNLDMQVLRRLMESIRRNIEDNVFICKGIQQKVTISLGAYLTQESKEDLDICIKNADDALYKAKKTGRNKAVIYNEWKKEMIE